MAREASGHIQWRGGEWETRVMDPATKKREWVIVEAGLKQNEEDLARALAQRLQVKWEGRAYVPNERELTVGEFFKRWQTWRLSKPELENQANTDEQAFRLWIDEQLGRRPMHAVTSDHLRAFSGWLDEKADEGVDFQAKRARNIFSVVAAMFRDAANSKNDKIRILSSNPCAGVPWPELPKGEPLHQLLYPNEFLALVSCPDVPLVRARLYAITTYTTTRIGEVRMFECDDFDVAHSIVKITKAHNNGKGKRGQAKGTKSDKSRMCTLEENLAPLVFDMIAERKEGRIFPDRPEGMPKGNQHSRQPFDYIPGTSKVCTWFMADLLKALAWAGLKVRPELVDKSKPTLSAPIRFHDLRASGITWRHARGDNPARIRQECGHENERTNDIYIRTLSRLDPAELFPALPARLLVNGPNKDQRTKKDSKNTANSCRRRESNILSGDRKVTSSRALSGNGHTSQGPNGHGSTQSPIAVIADAIQHAAKAGKWSAVEKLAKQLETLKRKR